MFVVDGAGAGDFAALALRQADGFRLENVVADLFDQRDGDGIHDFVGDFLSEDRLIGSYRAIYEIKDSELIVLVLKVGHRKDIYA